jgi:hypothetical protein
MRGKELLGKGLEVGGSIEERPIGVGGERVNRREIHRAQSAMAQHASLRKPELSLRSEREERVGLRRSEWQFGFVRKSERPGGWSGPLELGSRLGMIPKWELVVAAAVRATASTV